MQRGLCGPAAALAMAAVLAGCTSTAAGEPVRATPTASAVVPTAAPVIIRECWVRTSVGNVALDGEVAQALTTRAAELGDRTRSTARLVERLTADVAAVVDDDVAAAAPAEVAAGLAGVRRDSRLICAWSRAFVEPQEPGRDGLIPRARHLRTAWTRVFGHLTAGGFAPGGVRSGHVDGSAHYEGRALDVFFRPVGDDEQRRRGWVFAQWLVAHAPDHHILSVIFDDHIWTSWAGGAGWRDYVHPGATWDDRGNAVLRHKDHVHVAVESGRPWRG